MWLRPASHACGGGPTRAACAVPAGVIWHATGNLATPVTTALLWALAELTAIRAAQPPPPARRAPPPRAQQL
jgi:hypothetical protein